MRRYHMKKPRIDPISLEIQWKRLVSMVDEAATAFIRTSFSVLVREANDFAVVLTDAQGRSLAQSTMSIASFIGSLPATVKHFLKVFPAHTLKPGDVMITNDPWMGTGHIHDVNIAMPIFHKRKARRVCRGRIAHAGHRRAFAQRGRARDFRGRPADPASEADRRRQAEPDAVRHDRPERARAGDDAGRHLGAGCGVQDAGGAPAAAAA